MTTSTKSTVHDNVTEKESIYHELWFPTTDTEILTNRHVNGGGEGEVPHPRVSRMRCYGGGEDEIPHPRGSRVRCGRGRGRSLAGRSLTLEVQDLLGQFKLDSSDEVIPNHCSTINVHTEF